MEIHLLLQEEIFLQQGSSFESNPVTNPVVTQDSWRYQMNDVSCSLFCTPQFSLGLIGLNATAKASQSQAKNEIFDQS